MKDSRYEEALERAKQGLPMDEVFPELKESEDERIRFHLEKDKTYKRATPLHKIPFLLIGDEMWLNARNEE